MKLELLRSYSSTAVNGELWDGETLICYCIELPWRENARRISCIPEGEYVLQKRESKKFGKHLLIVGVKDRSLILFHAANVAIKELEGCISPVMKLTGLGTGIHSRMALQVLLKLVEGSFAAGEEVKLLIKERV